MMGDIQGVVPGVVMQTDDGVLHYGVNISCGRNEAFTALHALCDMEAQFPSLFAGLIQMALLRESGVRFSLMGRFGDPTCMACLATSRDRWVSEHEESGFG